MEVTETFKRVLGQEHPDTLTSMGNMNNFKVDFSEYEPQLHSLRNFAIRVGSKKTNWIRQLECTTPFAPLDPRLKQLLCLYSQCFSNLKEIRINLVLFANDKKKEISSILKKWKDWRSYCINVGIKQRCCGMKVGL